MAFANNGGVLIHYKVEGNGPPLVIMHGLGQSLEDFYSIGYVEALRDRHRLILIDARGHGKSDKPHEPGSYPTELFARDVTAVLDDLGISKSHYFGYSMGGHIGYAIAKYVPERFTSLIIGAASANDPGLPTELVAQMITILRQGREANASLLRAMVQMEMRTAQKPSLLEAAEKMLLEANQENDLEAMVALMTSAGNEYRRMADVLPHLTVPCLLIAGEADAVAFEGTKAASRLIPHARFISFLGLGHLETAMRLDLILPPILSFLSEVDATPKAEIVT